MGQVLHTNEWLLLFDTGLSTGWGHCCKIPHLFLCHLSQKMPLAGTFDTIFLTTCDLFPPLSWFILSPIHGSLWDSSLVKQFIHPWSRDTLLMAVRKVSSPAFKIYYFMGKQQEGKKAATEPPPDFCPVSILSNKIIYLVAFRKWYTGHLKYTYNVVSLSRSAAPAMYNRTAIPILSRLSASSATWCVDGTNNFASPCHQFHFHLFQS